MQSDDFIPSPSAEQEGNDNLNRKESSWNPKPMPKLATLCGWGGRWEAGVIRLIGAGQVSTQTHPPLEAITRPASFGTGTRFEIYIERDGLLQFNHLFSAGVYALQLVSCEEVRG